MADVLVCPVEVRASADGPRLVGVAIQEGTAARGGRAELFRPRSLLWPDAGIPLRLRHYGDEECRATVSRGEDGSIRIDAPATPAVVERVRAAGYLSVEFRAVEEVRTPAGIREIGVGVLTGVALTSVPEYGGTGVEVRQSARGYPWWL